MNAKISTALIVFTAAGCGTDTIELQTLEVLSAEGDNPASSKARLFVPRFDDREWVSDIAPEWMKVKLNGDYVVMKSDLDDKTHFVGAWGAFDVDPGDYLFELERPNGSILARQSITLAAASHNEIVVYGPTGTEHSKALLDTLAGVATGKVRARFMNVMDSHIPVDIMTCARSSWGCPPGVDCQNGEGAVCGRVTIGSDCTVVKAGLAYGEVWEQIVDPGADVRVRVPVKVGDGYVELGLPSGVPPDPSQASFQSVYPQHVWGPGDWFDVCTNFLQFQFVEPGTYQPPPR